MRVVIVDRSVAFMTALRRRLAEWDAAVEVTQYDAEQRGRPAVGFQWGLYDVAFFEHELDGRDGGIDWIEALRDAPGFPPAVVLSGSGGIYDAVGAMKRGASDFLLKRDLGTRLHRALDAVVNRDRTTDVPPAIPRVLEAATVCETPGTKPPSADREETAGGYEFVRLIGQGGMSTVYLAKRTDDEQILVLKTIEGRFLREPALRSRFLREAEIAMRLESPHVVTVFDYGIANNSAYISMEFFPRGDLKHRIELGLDGDEVLPVVEQIILGVDAMTEHGIVHRDLKPGNIMFRFDGSLAIADFGIAKHLDAVSDLTVDGQLLGTPHYMSPEQVSGRPVDGRTDLYSVGVILYQLLTGRRPFESRSLAAVLHEITHLEPPPLPERYAAFWPVVERLLAKDPDDRYPDGKATLDALRRAAAAGGARALEAGAAACPGSAAAADRTVLLAAVPGARK